MKNAIWLGVVLTLVGLPAARAGHESHGDGEFGAYAHIRLLMQVSSDLEQAGDVLPPNKRTVDRLDRRWSLCSYQALNGAETLAVVTTGDGFCRVAVRPHVWNSLQSVEARWLGMCEALLRDLEEVDSDAVCAEVWARQHTRSPFTF